MQARSAELGGSGALAAYATIAATGAGLAALTQVAAGFISDARFRRAGHRREFYLAGIALSVPALIAFFTVSSLTALLFAFALLQIGMNVLGGPYQAAVPDHVEESHRGRASAWMSGYQFTGQCAGLVDCRAVHRTESPGSPPPDCWQPRSRSRSRISHASRPRLHSAPRAAIKLRVNRDFRTVLVSRAWINLGFYTLVGFLFFFVQDALHAADPRRTTGILFLIFTIAGVGGAALAGAPSDRLDKRIVVIAAGLAIAIAIGALASY